MEVVAVPDSCLDIEVHAESGRVTLVLSGEIDIESAPMLKTCIQELDAAWTVVVLDMGAVTFMDSSGIAVVLRARSALESASRHLQLRDLSEPVRRLLQVAGTLDVLTLTPAESAPASVELEAELAR